MLATFDRIVSLSRSGIAGVLRALSAVGAAVVDRVRIVRNRNPFDRAPSEPLFRSALWQGTFDVFGLATTGVGAIDAVVARLDETGARSSRCYREAIFTSRPRMFTAIATLALTANTIYGEGLGPGFAYSMNYERTFADALGVRVGAGYLAAADAPIRLLSIPVTASFIGIARDGHALELGGGVTIRKQFGDRRDGEALAPFNPGASTRLNLVLLAGYRYQPSAPFGLQFRAGFSGLIGDGVEIATPGGGLSVWPYVSVGLSF